MSLTGSNRNIVQINFKSPKAGIEQAVSHHRTGNYPAAFDCIESLLKQFPREQVFILAAAYNLYQAIPVKSRYNLYVSRFFDFNINEGDKVLDIGSGHLPFPHATHLADCAVEENDYGRAGAPFTYVADKPVYHCDVENMPFENGAFDFIYCSHVLEHVKDPSAACKELARVAGRGYIETPSRGKDIFLASADISNHRWSVELVNNVLVFTEYSESQKKGLESNILMDMHVRPASNREKAFSALIYLKADQVNTMLAWRKEIPFDVRRRKIFQVRLDRAKNELKNRSLGGGYSPGSKTGTPLKLMQVHTFYPAYLEHVYQSRPGLARESFSRQMQALEHDAFSGIHILAPYIQADPRFAYTASLVIANCHSAQARWLAENRIKIDRRTSMEDVLRWQIEALEPDVIYFTDPVTFDDRFIQTLKKRPSLILGWRAANIPEDTRWSEFDCILSSLRGIREMAKTLGAKNTLHFRPGFPKRIADHVSRIEPVVDVVFAGQYTESQHSARNRLLRRIAESSHDLTAGAFSADFHLSGQMHLVPESMRAHLCPPVYGLAMHRALRRGRIAFDARGDIGYKKMGTKNSIDLARNETANMRIFEATGSGIFLLTEHCDNLSRDFIIGKEIESFRDEKELLEKIRFYLANPQKREEIALAGQNRCLRDHSMAKRLEDFDTIIRGLLENKTAGAAVTGITASRSSTLADIITTASDLINQGHFKSALDMLSKAKAMRAPHLNLDYYRAMAFWGLNQPQSCREALKEELRYFPNNKDAVRLYSKLSESANRETTVSVLKDEFDKLHASIAPYTMVGAKRLKYLYHMALQICEKDIPGNFVECGVAAGGSSALLAHVIKRYSKTPRVLFAFDSFEGMPAPTREDTHNGMPADETGWGTGTCAAPVESLRELCAALDVLDIVKPVKGYFQQTLPEYNKNIGDIALLHMDGDWYESTKTILDNLYDQVVSTGYVQIDDYGHWQGCKKAVSEFFQKRKLSVMLKKIDDTGVWFKKR